MIDLHTHILPQMDDGSDSVTLSHRMLLALRQQGVQLLAATPHFYAYKEAPQTFLKRRQEAYDRLAPPEGSPEIMLGAEVAYFSGISRSDEMRKLRIGNSRLLLLELPFSDWSRTMVHEVLDIGKNLSLTPVLAHIDRYRRVAGFWQTLELFSHAGVLLQCNAEAIGKLFSRRLIGMVKDGQIQFLGSDCHNMTTRPPNMHKAVAKLEKSISLQTFDRRARRLLGSDRKEEHL